VKRSPGLVVWFSGLPGSGKSTIAELIIKNVGRKSEKKIILVSMDSIRKKIFPKPNYADQERDAAYRSFVLIGSFLSKAGATVLLDATGHKLAWRYFARKECPRFVEVYIKCPIEICIKRESTRKNNNAVRKKLYLNALARLRKGKRISGLGKVPGVDEPFEESPSAEIVLDSSHESPRLLAEKAIKKLRRFDPKIFQ